MLVWLGDVKHKEKYFVISELLRSKDSGKRSDGTLFYKWHTLWESVLVSQKA